MPFRGSNNAFTAVIEPLEERIQGKIAARPAPPEWDDWLPLLFPAYFSESFADRHTEFWQWVTSIELDSKPDPFVAIWGRGGAKSTNAEATAVWCGAHDTRRYIWYISETQDQADEHVANIASMLESSELEKYYPQLASRKLGKFGHSKGWRRNRLRTASGLTIDALGLDTARRGFKVEEQRPDMMIFDDIDSDLDKIEATDKKESIITKKLLPAGSNNCAVLMVQNLVLATGIFGRLHDGTARYLANRVVSGPHPAVTNLKTENIDGFDTIVEGVATWAGQSIETCQAQIIEWGLPAFLAEAQHDVYNRSGQVFLPEWFSIKDGRNRYSINDQGMINRTVSRYQFWDTALKDKKQNDPSMCITVDLLPNYTAVLRDVWQDRIESAYLPEMMQAQAAKWNYDHKLVDVVIEDKGSGTTSIQTIRKNAPTWLADKVQEFTPHGSKDYRARTASMWMPRDTFLIPYLDDSLLWYNELLDDLKGQFFRFAGEGTVPHDEFIDCVSMAVLYLEHYISQGFYARLQNVNPMPERPFRGFANRIEQALKEANE
jgi:phage terminase large subunit-like protein